MSAAAWITNAYPGTFKIVSGAFEGAPQVPPGSTATMEELARYDLVGIYRGEGNVLIDWKLEKSL